MVFSNYARHLTHGAYSMLNRLGVVGFSFLNVLLMVRMMPKEVIGVWVLYSTIAAVIEMMRAGFIRNPFIILLVNAEENEKNLITNTSLALHSLLAFVSSFVLLITGAFFESFWNAPELKSLFYLYAIQNILLIPFFHFEYLQTASLRFRAIFYSNVIRQGLPSLFILIMFLGSGQTTLIEISLAQIVGTVLGCFIAYWYVRDLVKVKQEISRKTFFDLFNFGKFTLGTNISSTVLRSTDSWMLGRLSSPAAVAIYNPALKLANIFEVPNMAICNIIFPQIALRMKENGKSGVREIYLKSVSLILAITIPMVAPLYFFSEFFVVTIFGAAYIDSADILKVTVMYSLIIPFNRQFGITMDALQKPKLNFYLLVIATIINGVLNYFMLQWFGIIGCAYATLISFIFLFSINQVILHNQFQINTLKVFVYIVHWYLLAWTFISSKVIKARI